MNASKQDLMRKGALADARERLEANKTEIRRLSGEIMLHASDIGGIDNVDAEATLQVAQQLKAAKDKRAEILAEIKDLEI